ncbi:MAG TPA: GYF domain-containing protein [Planctomycetaceae bacterium]|nr:GYF domain-containing protein [Planctomycetaceae bacterium]
MSNDWYVRKGDKALGPLSEEWLRKALAAGRISGRTAVRRGLTGSWIAAASVLDRSAADEPPRQVHTKSPTPIVIAVVAALAVLLGGLWGASRVYDGRAPAASAISDRQLPIASLNEAQERDAPATAVDSAKPPDLESTIKDKAVAELEPIRFTVRFPSPSKHLAEVEARYPTEGRESVELMMPIWTPGYYHVENFARHVLGLSARTPDGRTLAVKQPRKNRWTVETGGARNVVVSYQLQCESPSVVESWVGDDMAVLNGAATFLTLVETARRPHEVQLELPPRWQQSVSGLETAPDHRANHYRAGDFDTLVDSPIVAGKLELHEFDVAGTKYVVAATGNFTAWDASRAAADLEKLVREHRRMWGFLPFKQYVFLCVFRNGGGGLEHKNSTLLNSNETAMKTPASYVVWLTFVSHEYFHAFNVKRLRPVELGPFDYENVPRTSGLWVAEGVTSYYDGLLVTRAGLGAPKDFLARLSKTIDRVQKTPGRLHQTLEQSSLDVWTSSFSGYRGDINKTVSYYDKGCVVAFLLDAKVRQATRGQKSLDDVMRLAYQRYSGEKGFTSGEFRKTAEDVAGADLEAWFKKAVASTEELHYAPALDWFGLRLTPGDGKAKAWQLDVRPDPTPAQREHLTAWLKPEAKAATSGGHASHLSTDGPRTRGRL